MPLSDESFEKKLASWSAIKNLKPVGTRPDHRVSTYRGLS